MQTSNTIFQCALFLYTPPLQRALLDGVLYEPITTAMAGHFLRIGHAYSVHFQLNNCLGSMSAFVHYLAILMMVHLYAQQYTYNHPNNPAGDNMKRSLAVLKTNGHYAHILSTGTDQALLEEAVAAQIVGRGPHVCSTNVVPNGEHLEKVSLT